MKKLYLFTISILILSCIVPTIPSNSLCTGTFQSKIQKDNGTDTEGYHTYQTNVTNDQTYPVKYKISSNATLESIFLDKDQPSFNIFVREVSQGGNITIELPTKLLGSYNGGYYFAAGAMCGGILDRDFPTPIESNSDFTTVSFPLMNYSGGEELMIISGNNAIPEGNQTIPEFPFAMPVLVIGIISFIIMSRPLTRRITRLMSP